MQKKYKILFIFFIFLIAIVAIGSVWLAPIEVTTSGTDIIKNSKVESFGKQHIIDYMTEDNKICVETGVWQINKDDIKELYTIVDETNNVMYVYYQIPITNQINVFTSITAGQSVEKMYKVTSENFKTVDWKWIGLDDKTRESQSKYMQVQYYDMGNYRTWNEANNVFSGTVQWSFDISTNLMPALVTDSGFEFKKQADIITINSAVITDSSVGLMSDFTPIVKTTTASESDAPPLEESSGTDDQGDYKNWNYNVDADWNIYYTTWDVGCTPASPNSEINMLTKGWSAPWDAENADKSMENARLSINIPRLTPLVKQYCGTVSYTAFTFRKYDQYFTTTAKYSSSTSREVTPAFTLGMHVSNRYMHYEIELDARIWCKYSITSLDEGNKLQDPSETFHEVVFDAVASGASGEGTRKEAISSDIFTDFFKGIGDFFTDNMGIVITIVIIIIGVIATVIVVKVIITAKTAKRVSTFARV